MLPLRPVRPVNMSVLWSLSALSGAAGVHPVGGGPVWVRSIAEVGLPPLLAHASASSSAAS